MRRETEHTITSEGRDKGKTFKLTEMPADQGERWAYRALLALSRGGFELPPGIFEAGMAGLAAIVPYLVVVGFRSLQGARWEELESLLDEMMACVKYVPPMHQGQKLPAQELYTGVNCQIEEVRTRVELRKEVLMLHVSPFDLAVFQSSDHGDSQESKDSSAT